MTPEEYIRLFEKYQQGQCTPEEEALLMEYQDHFQLQEEEPAMSAADKELRRRIFGRIATTAGRKKVFRLRWGWAAAAIVILAAGMGALLLNRQPDSLPEIVEKAPVKNGPITPGSSMATLTLADGAVIALEDAADGIVARAGGTAVTKTGKGAIAYADQGGATDQHSLNTINIPRGGQYTVTLSDGTKVWLNSESSLTYPVVFGGAERKVILKGEAYFEVSKNEQKPFIAETDHATVHVLGTQFNINAYHDEKDVKVTLQEGSVRLSSEADKTLLTPGEQGIVSLSHTAIEKKKVNMNQVMAWKNGYFIFRNNTIQDIMRQIGRWYDVEVVYEGNLPKGTFGGTYSRNKDIHELLKGLELTGLVHFKIEGRRIIVMT
ncbi:FecR domain-containing protein [uncultured Chitinophaga sp.]|jgi:Fe2+-dicitrate sensor, membrane component|uniref:FecR family protein n=1 Tax=uncultured Chitinophaga sp. TaxID=339340 RepID=UPI002637A5A3|nr:FecR domain-containing protein [uncultured Chitinophaga sp.]